MRLYQACSRCLLAQPNVHAVLMVIANVFTANRQQMSLIERNDVIQHLAAAAAHPSLCGSILPRTPDAGPNGLDAALLQEVPHGTAELGIAVE